jgi:hypothetical protein
MTIKAVEIETVRVFREYPISKEETPISTSNSFSAKISLLLYPQLRVRSMC